MLKYEDLRADPGAALARVMAFFDIEGATPELVERVVAAASKAEMARRPNPEVKLTVVRMDETPSEDWFSDEDRRFLSEVCRRNLKHTFGYEYW